MPAWDCAAGGADVAEAEAFLARHPGIAAVEAFVIDANGIGRGKLLRRHELPGLYQRGRHLPGSVLGLDVTGEDATDTGLVWAVGDADVCAWPVPGSLCALPWTDPPRGQVQLSMRQFDGAPLAFDSRQALARQEALLRHQGRQPVLAFELEFYLLDRARDAHGQPQPARLPLTGERPSATQVYRMDELDRLEPFVNAVYAAAEAQDIPLETMISEYAVGQYELTLRHRADALQAADDLVRLKRLLRGLAVRHDMLACFMSKPFAERSGSGMHLHASLADAAGRNLFADTAGGLAPLLRHAVSGLLETMTELMLVFAPHLNSWRRFSSHSFAPMRPDWGSNNRSVAVRVPAGDPANRHLEQRCAGVDANPYLVAATVLAGMGQGMAAAREPGAPVVGNGYEAAAPAALPPDWRGAIEQAGASAFLREALGTRMAEVYIAIKRAEYRRLAATVTREEIETYVETV